MLELEKPEYILEEKDTLDKIFKSIDKKNAFIFNAGAGAGKTFSLIESLKYICIKYGVEMGKNNQCIVCITYTNVAAKEIMNRLGNSSLVLVSTIHERVWSFIKNYQMELLEIHINNLNEQIIELRSKLLNDKEFSEYNKLGEEQKQAFYTKMSALKSVFYANYDKRAAEFRGTLINEMQDFSALLNNVSNFKKMVGILYKIHNYEECIEKIFRGEKGYKAISYNILNNTEQLHKMEIGHDTVLKYGLEMIKEYDLLKRVIIDRYPYILIDEYQDTSTPVIEMMQKLRDYSMAIGHPMLLGYYGDAMQNIYTDGIGDALLNPKNNFEIIDKRLNRRSFAEIIEVSNRIRKDRILQVSLYEDCVGGNVSFYVGSVRISSRRTPVKAAVLSWLYFSQILTICSKIESYSPNSLSASSKDRDTLLTLIVKSAISPGIWFSRFLMSSNRSAILASAVSCSFFDSSLWDFAASSSSSA